jgi:DNA polymerase V
MKAEMICGPEGLKGLLIPMIQADIPAGIPEQQFDPIVSRTALFAAIVTNPDNTYVLRAKGESMTGAGIDPGDYLVVDRVIHRRADSIIIADVDGEYTVKRFEQHEGRLRLVPANPSYQPISLSEYQSCRAWGVVTFVIKPMYGRPAESSSKPLPPEV